MTPVTWQPEVCPACNRVLEGLGRWCPSCAAYTEDMAGATTDATPEVRARKEIPDTRLEDERKADARQIVEAALVLPWSAMASDNLRKGLEPAKWSEYKLARDTASAKAREQLGPGVRFPSRPVRVRIVFWLPDARRRDPNNLTKLITDALSGVAYGDDSQICAMEWALGGTDRTAARAEITVSAMEGWA